jgi:hypothetical protein
MVERYVGKQSNGGVEVPLVLYDSSSLGDAFQTRAFISGRGTDVIGGYPGGLLDDGTFITAFSDSPVDVSAHRQPGSPASHGKVRVFRYNRNNRADTTISDVDDLSPCNPDIASLPIPSLAVDSSRGAFHGRVYAAWPDSRLGRCEILLSTSADGGTTWSKPTIVNDDLSRSDRSDGSSGPDDFHPVLAVNQEGVLGVFWCDRRDNPDNLGWRPRFSASVDGGQTFLSSVEMDGSGMVVYQLDNLELHARRSGGGSPHWHSPGVIQTSLGYIAHGITGGETSGLASDALGVFHPLWIDDRSGIRQVWTTRVTVHAEAVATNGLGDEGHSSLADVSENVALLFSDVRLDKKRGEVSATAYLQNTSHSALRAPLVLRIVQLGSRLGRPEIVNADNHRRQSGATFDFTAVIEGAVLQPGQRSGGKRILVHLDQMPSAIPPGNYEMLSEIVKMGCLIFGSSDSLSHRP